MKIYTVKNESCFNDCSRTCWRDSFQLAVVEYLEVLKKYPNDLITIEEYDSFTKQKTILLLA